MARLRDDTFEMLVMAQYYVARHGGVDTMEVSILFNYYLAVLVTGREQGVSLVSATFTHWQGLTRRESSTHP